MGVTMRCARRFRASLPHLRLPPQGNALLAPRAQAGIISQSANASPLHECTDVSNLSNEPARTLIYYRIAIVSKYRGQRRTFERPEVVIGGLSDQPVSHDRKSMVRYSCQYHRFLSLLLVVQKKMPTKTFPITQGNVLLAAHEVPLCRRPVTNRLQNCAQNGTQSGTQNGTQIRLQSGTQICWKIGTQN